MLGLLAGAAAAAAAPLPACAAAFTTAPRRALLQAGASLCHFLSLRATVNHTSAGAGAAAEVLLLFGGPGHLGSGPAGCSAVDDSGAAAAAAIEFEWPEVAGVEVLGWRLPAEGAQVEVVQRTDSCGGLQVVRRLAALPAGAVGAGPDGLRLDLSSLSRRLTCPDGLRVSWSAGPGVLSDVHAA